MCAVDEKNDLNKEKHTEHILNHLKQKLTEFFYPQQNSKCIRIKTEQDLLYFYSIKKIIQYVLNLPINKVKFNYGSMYC